MSHFNDIEDTKICSFCKNDYPYLVNNEYCENCWDFTQSSPLEYTPKICTLCKNECLYLVNDEYCQDCQEFTWQK